MNTPQLRYLEDGNGQDYVFDKVSKKGWCNVCSVELSSIKQAEDHLVSQGHDKKRKKRETLPSLGLMPSTPTASLSSMSLDNQNNPQNPRASDENMQKMMLKERETTGDGGKGSILSKFGEDCVSLQSGGICPVQSVTPCASKMMSYSMPLPSNDAFSDSLKPFSRLENSNNNYVPQQSQIAGRFRQGETEIFFFDENTNKGWCYLCNVELSSKTQSDDHLSSQKHKKKEKSRGTLTGPGPVRPMTSMTSAVSSESHSCPGIENASSLPKIIGRDQDSVLKEKIETGSNDTTSSYFIESKDVPDDWPSVETSKVQPFANNALSLQPDNIHSLPTAFQDLIKPLLNVDNDSGTVSSQLSQFTEGEGVDYVFNRSTNKGFCFVCNVEFQSEMQAEAHLTGTGHGKRKKAKETSGRHILLPQETGCVAAVTGVSPEINKHHLSIQEKDRNAQQNFNGNVQPCNLCNATFTCESDRQKHLAGKGHKKKEMSLIVEAERQNQVYNDLEQTKKKGLLESEQKTVSNDQEQTAKKAFFQSSNFPVDHGESSSSEMLQSRNQTQVKTSPYERPTAVVPPRNVILPDSCPASQRIGNAGVVESGSQEATSNIPVQDAGDANDFYCDICNVQSTSREMDQEHRNGRQHRTKLKNSRVHSQDDTSKRVTLSLNLKLEV